MAINKYCQYNNQPGTITIRDRYWNLIEHYDYKTNISRTDNVRARIKWLETETNLLAVYGRVQYEIDYIPKEIFQKENN